MSRARARAPQERERGTGSIYVDGDGFRAAFPIPVNSRQNGKSVVKKRFSTRKAAEEWLDDLVLRHLGGGALTATEALTVGDLADKWMQARHDAWTPASRTNARRHVENYIRPHLGHLALSRITRDNIERLMAHVRDMPSLRSVEAMERYEERMTRYRASQARTGGGRRMQEPVKPETKTLEPSSRKTLYTHLHAMFEWAVQTERITRNPVTAVDAPRYLAEDEEPDMRKKVMKGEDLLALLSFAVSVGAGCSPENHAGSHMCGVHFQLRATMGSRTAEVLGLRLSDCTFVVTEGLITAAVVHLQRRVVAKSFAHGCRKIDGAPGCGKRFGRDCPKRKDGGLTILPGLKQGRRATHRIRFDPYQAGLLSTHVKALQEAGWTDASYLFGGKEAPFSPFQDARAFERFQRDAGIEVAYSPHDFRRTAASTIANSGIDIAAAQSLLDHADIRTTRRYVVDDEGRTTQVGAAEMSRLLQAGIAESGVSNLAAALGAQAQVNRLLDALPANLLGEGDASKKQVLRWVAEQLESGTFAMPDREDVEEVVGSE